MNSLIILAAECVDGSSAVLEGQRACYAFETHGIRAGQRITVGVLNGLRGEAEVASASPSRVELSLFLSDPPLSVRPIDLIVGVSRPQTIKKVVQVGVMLGVRSVHFVRSERGDKSYLQSTALSPESLQEESLKALEQIWDTRMPDIIVHRSFQYFCKNVLPALEGDGAPLKVVAHPNGEGLRRARGESFSQHAIVAVGPERGWSDVEVQLLKERGFRVTGLGSRVLRVEVALTFLLGQLDLLLAS